MICDLLAAAAEPDLLNRVTVRLLEEGERPAFDQLLVARHYLHDARLGGQALRYVAELDGQWVALLSFSAPALHLKGREQWIGWSPRQRARRLDLVVNNSRFLVLPERARFPNLASRVPGLCLRRLSEDWQQRWGHPVLVVESFVDETQYRGTCYRACGFKAVGATKGYGRDKRDFYVRHDQPKQLYLRALRPAARALLKRARWSQEWAQYERPLAGPCPFRAPELRGLLDRLATLKDDRCGHGLQHRQRYVLACAAVATLMGAGTYSAFESTCGKFTQRQLRALGATPNERTGRFRAPSDSTFQRTCARIDPDLLAGLVGRWLAGQEIGAVARLAIDGKVLRGSGRADGKALHLLSAVTHHLRLTLDHLAIEDKSNEIPAFGPLLEKIKPRPGTLFTADAMHCQQESSRIVVQDYGGDYLWGLKGNQSGVLERAESRLQQAAFSPGGPGGEGPRPD